MTRNRDRRARLALGLASLAWAPAAGAQVLGCPDPASFTGAVLLVPPPPPNVVGHIGIGLIRRFNGQESVSPAGCTSPSDCQSPISQGACYVGNLYTSGEGEYEFGASTGIPGYTTARGGSGTCVVDNAPLQCQGSFTLKLYKVPDDPPFCQDCPANVGAPVNVITGNTFLSQTDIAIPGAPGVGFVRWYNSLHARWQRGGGFGRGWFHSNEQSIDFPSSDVMRARQANGTALYFWDEDGDGRWQPMLPVTEKSYVLASSGGYTRHLKSGAVESYDALGRIVQATDEAGRTTSYARDGAGRLVSVTAGGRALSLGYDALGRIETLDGPDGRIATYGYDPGGFLGSVRYADGSGFRFGYDSQALLTSVTDSAGRVVERHQYLNFLATTSELADGQEKYSISYGDYTATVTDALGNQTKYQWLSFSGNHKLVRIEGPCPECGAGSDVQSFTYDDDGRRLSETNASGTTSYTYDAEGEVATVTDALGRVTSYSYDARGRVLTQAEPGGRVVSYAYADPGPVTIGETVTASETRTTALAYNGQGLVSTVTDPRGKVTGLAYDGFGQLVSVTDPLGHATTFGYDALGRRTSVTDALGHVTATAYDPRGRVTRITSHDGTHTDFSYDAAGRRTAVVDPLGRTTRYVYDVQGRLGAVIDPLNGATRYGYDAMSRLTSLTDANGNTTAFDYDGHGRVTKVTYPGGAFESFSYDSNGRLQTKTDRKGVTTSYSYDALGRLTGKTYSDGTTPPVSYSYDLAGRLATAANGTDTLTWTYDLAGQLLSEQSSKNASTVAYSYDPAGNRLSVSLDGQLFVSYAYDDASRLTTITRGSNVFGFGYDNANRRTSMTYPNGVNTTYSYDNLNRLLNLQANHTPTSTTITNFTYTYDAAGNRLTKQQPDYTESYKYDPLYRLTQAERTGSLTGIQTWSYDSVGNRLTNQKDGAVTTSSYNEKNQLTSAAGGGTMLWRGSLDEPGNVSFTSALVNGKPARMLPGNVFEAMLPMTSGSNTVTLEARDTTGNVATKQYSVNVTGDGATYAYDANGNLAQKVESGDTWVYTWNAENQLTKVEKNAAEVAAFKYDPLGRRVEKAASGTTSLFTYTERDIHRKQSGAATTRFIHGPSVDEPLATETAGVLQFLQADALGSLVAATDGSGVSASNVRYDVWGNVEAGSPGQHAFTGREHDGETGLAFYRARYLAPNVGRFLSQDPIGFAAGVNFYSYVLNSPADLIDPLGLDVQVCVRQAHNLPEGVPHTLLYPTSSKPTTGPGTGKCIASGFGPASGFAGKGKIFDEPICDEYGNPHPAYSCSTVSTSNCVEDCVKKLIVVYKNNPPPYRPTFRDLGGNICTDFTTEVVAICQTRCPK